MEISRLAYLELLDELMKGSSSKIKIILKDGCNKVQEINNVQIEGDINPSSRHKGENSPKITITLPHVPNDLSFNNAELWLETIYGETLLSTKYFEPIEMKKGNSCTIKWALTLER